MVIRRWVLISCLGWALATAALAQEDPQASFGVGDPAPDFRLNDQDGRVVHLSAYGRGAWTVIAFYPKASTPG